MRFCLYLEVMFQSTLPVWGATCGCSCPRRRYCCFNPRSPCGERPVKTTSFALSTRFQSTLPVWGATLNFGFFFAANMAFQSTLPVWGATKPSCTLGRMRPVSIHAPRVGSDTPEATSKRPMKCFNPRSPCGERLHPGRLFDLTVSVSIHAPRVGSDPAVLSKRLCKVGFNPRSPCGERRAEYGCQDSSHQSFNPRSPCGERP